MKQIVSRFTSLFLSVSLIPSCHFQVFASGTDPYSYSDELGITYSVYTDHASVTGYEGINTELEIPSEICGVPVTEIGFIAFYESKIYSVTLPETVTKIGVLPFRSAQVHFRIMARATKTAHPIAQY